MTTSKALGVEAGQHVLRVVVDVVQQCNLRCTYCHPGNVWEPLHLDVRHIEAVFEAAESSGVLELVVSGGEPTLHPGFDEVLAATHGLRRTASVLVTNATRVDDRRVQRIAASNLTRVCVSLDGADDLTHASARGDNRARVVEGLRRIRATGLPVTVISVAHRGNVGRLVPVVPVVPVVGVVGVVRILGDLGDHHPQRPTTAAPG